MIDYQLGKVFTKGDPEPDVPSGTIAMVNYGDYRKQEVWVASGANIGNWYPLGGEFWIVYQRHQLPPGVTTQDTTWDDVVARGPVVLMVPSPQEAYEQGWRDGRRRLLESIESLHDYEDPPQLPRSLDKLPLGRLPKRWAVWAALGDLKEFTVSDIADRLMNMGFDIPNNVVSNSLAYWVGRGALIRERKGHYKAFPEAVASIREQEG